MEDFDRLPHFYESDGGARIERPVYLLLADCFLGRPGGPPAYWEAGTELETDLVPNEHMKPLNRAAGIAFANWEASLPPPASAVTPDELMEAANILMKSRKPEDPEIPYEIWRGTVYQLAMDLKTRRGGRAPVPPPSTAIIAPVHGRPVPPMSAGDFKDVTHRDPSITGLTAHPQNAAAKRHRRPTAPAMSTEPKPPAGDAVGM
jgi:hypothetical protein